MSPVHSIISHVFSNNRKDASWEVNTLPTMRLLDSPLGAHALPRLVLASDSVDISEVLLVHFS